MMSSIKTIKDYVFKSSDRLLLDTNIWLFIYYPNPGDRRVDIYSRAFDKILKAKSNIYVDALIVSEFINVYARQKWNLTEPKPSESFKIFRKSRDFKPIAREIADNIKRVLQSCTRIGNGFEDLAINHLIDEYAEGNSDFNDQVLTDLCKRQGLTLVTDDGDFKGTGISIISGNRRLIS